MKTTQDTRNHEARTATQANAWRQFRGGLWQDQIDVRDFIQQNYKPFTGDYAFLKGPTAKTEQLWADLKQLLEAEREAGGVLDADTKVVGSVASHGAGYINQALETIVGVQTDKPLKRAMLPYGGVRIAQKALQAHGENGRRLRHRYFQTRARRARGRAMDLLRLPRRRQRSKRGSHVLRAHRHFLRHLLRARLRRGHDQRGSRAGDH